MTPRFELPAPASARRGCFRFGTLVTLVTLLSACGGNFDVEPIASAPGQRASPPPVETETPPSEGSETPPPAVVEPAVVPTREVMAFALDESTAVYQPGQPVKVSLQVDVQGASPNAGQADTEVSEDIGEDEPDQSEMADQLFDAEFAKLHFLMISKAESEVTVDDEPIGSVFAVARQAISNVSNGTNLIEVEFQIPTDIDASGTYELLSFVETPDKPLEETAEGDESTPVEELITVQSIDLVIDASTPYHDIELSSIESEELMLVVDPQVSETHDIDLDFETNYWGVAGFEPVNPEFGVRVGRPRFAHVRAELLVSGEWRSLNFISTLGLPKTIEPDGDLAEIEFSQAGNLQSFSVSGTVSADDIATLTAEALASVPPGSFDPTVSIADVPLRLTLIDAEGVVENDTDNNQIETTIPLYALSSDPVTVSQNSFVDKSLKKFTEGAIAPTSVDASGACLIVPGEMSRTFRKEFGSRERFKVGAELGATRREFDDDRSFRIWGKADVTLVRRKREVFKVEAFAGQSRTDRRVTKTVSAFGQEIYSIDPLDMPVSETFEESLAFPLFSKDVRFFKARFTVGPIPLSVSAGVEGSIGAEGVLTIDDALAISGRFPRTNFDVYLRGGIDLLLVSAGVEARGTIAESYLQARASMDLVDGDGNGECDSVFDISTRAKFLGVRAGLFAEVFDPGRPRICSKRTFLGRIRYPCGWTGRGTRRFNHWLYKSGYVYNNSDSLFRISTSRPLPPEVDSSTETMFAGFGPQLIGVEGNYLTNDISLQSEACSDIQRRRSVGGPSLQAFICTDPVQGTYDLQVLDGPTRVTRQVRVIGEPQISSVTPTTTVQGQLQEFTVEGIDLTDEMLLELDACPQPVLYGSDSSTSRRFECTFDRSGEREGTVEDGETSLPFTVTVLPDATLTRVSPSTAVAGIRQTFTVSGTKLSSDMNFSLPGCSNLEPAGGSATSRSFSCVPTLEGTLQGSVVLAPASLDFSVTVTFSGISGVSPLTTLVGVEQTFVVSGRNLDDQLTFELEQCSNLREEPGGTSSRRAFTCTPSVAGELSGTASLGSSEENFTVDVVEDLTITSVSPNSAVVGVESVFEVTGSNLSSRLRLNLANCFEETHVGGDETTQRISCIPSRVGEFTGVATEGLESLEFAVEVVANTEITQVSAGVAFASLAVELTVTGTDLTDALELQVDNCAAVTALPGGNDTLRRFSCTPQASGNLAGTATNGPAAVNFSIAVLPLPSITSVETVQAVAGIETEFLVSGSNLLPVVDFALTGCPAAIEVQGGTSESRRFTCIPAESGSFSGNVTSGPARLGFEVAVIPNSQITSVSPLVALAGEPVLLTVSGTDLTDSIEMTFVGCSDLLLQPGGTASLRVFECTAEATGSFPASVTNGIDTFEFTVEVSDRTLISTVSLVRGVAQAGNLAEFIVTGVALTDAIELFWPACEGEAASALPGGSSTERRFSCEINQNFGPDELEGFVFDQDAELIFTATVWPAAQVDAVTPGKVLQGISQTFGISGSWLRDGLTVTLENCAELSVIDKGTPELQNFTCRPTTTGTLNGVVSDGALNAPFSVEVSERFDQIQLVSGPFTTGFPGVGQVAEVGDLDADGYPELLVGDPGTDRVYLLWGADLVFDDDFELRLENLGDVGVLLRGPGFRGVGSAVSSAGDVDGDGVPDLLISSVNGDSYVVWGSALLAQTDQLIELENLGSDGVRFRRSNVNAIAAMGDLDGDGFDDIVFGSGDSPTTGVSFLIWGSAIANDADGVIDLAVLGDSGIQIVGANAGDRSGTGLAAIEDIDGDGLMELAIGSRQSVDPIFNPAGTTYLVWGATLRDHPSNLLNLGELADGGIRIFGGSVGGFDSSQPAAAGDVDNDGRGELLITRANDNQVVLLWGAGLVGAGSNVNLEALTPALGLQVTIESPVTFLPSNAASGGDIDGDGYDEILIGNPNERSAVDNSTVGETWVVWGSAIKDRTVAVINTETLPSSVGVNLVGTQRSGLAGGAVAPIGDLDGDGLADIAITATGFFSSDERGFHLLNGAFISSERAGDGTILLPSFQ